MTSVIALDQIIKGDGFTPAAVTPSDRNPSRRNSPTCEMILNVIGDFLTDRCQLEQFVLDDGILCLFGLLPIHGGLLSQIVRPIHALDPSKALEIAS